MNDACVACQMQPNCDNSWYQSGLCRECLYISRQREKCQECYNSALYCCCPDGDQKRAIIREQFHLDEGRPRPTKKPAIVSVKLAGLPPEPIILP